MKNYNTFMEDLASPKPAPGGGSASAFVGVISSSLCSMVASLTRGKKNYEAVQEEIERLSRKAQDYANQFETLMEDDEKAFNAMMDARKLPRDTDDNRRHRENEINRTMKAAISVPWKTAQLCYKTMELSRRLCQIGNKNAITDAAAAGYLSSAAIESVLLNVKINLKSIKDEKFVDSEKLKLRLFNENVRDIISDIRKITEKELAI
ncbi:MAG: cyclodeaminase/cyclohydrolase family protein [Thermoplasmataceae archaeon]|jgi:formiminotetrahydrofolate cyclodeaminase|nr:MAG: formiminotransferase cyclodeaminase related protein [Thermoplasmatales archaeon E-plasma]